MSLVPSQDKALLALNPSALMKKRLTAHTEKLVLSATQRPSHTHTQTYTLTISCQNESDLCGLVSQDRWRPSAEHNVAYEAVLEPSLFSTSVLRLFYVHLNYCSFINNARKQGQNTKDLIFFHHFKAALFMLQ